MAADGQELHSLLCFYKPTTWEVEYETNVVKRVERCQLENEQTTIEEEIEAMQKAAWEQENARSRKQKERALRKERESNWGSKMPVAQSER